MRLSFDIKCEDHITQPAYRVLVNGELIAERDFVISKFELLAIIGELTLKNLKKS